MAIAWLKPLSRFRMPQDEMEGISIPHSNHENRRAAHKRSEAAAYLLTRALSDRSLVAIKLLVQYGADIHSVDFADVCRTGQLSIIQFFLDRGIDTESSQPFARVLCNPGCWHFGLYMDLRGKIPSLERQLSLALRYHARAGNAISVCLLLRAGGDPHICLPDIGTKYPDKPGTSAIEEAIWSDEECGMVERIGIDPSETTSTACSQSRA